MLQVQIQEDSSRVSYANLTNSTINGKLKRPLILKEKVIATFTNIAKKITIIITSNIKTN